MSFKTKVNFKGAFGKNKKKNKSQTINLFLSSVYHPVDEKDQLFFNNYLSSIYDSVPPNYVLMSGQDMNANIGVSKRKTDCKNIGTFGFDNRNKKGVEAVNLLRMNNFSAPLTFFDHKNLVTWRSFDGKNTPFQLDHWITNKMGHIKDCKVVNFGVPSDHSAVKIVLKFKTPIHNKISYANNID